MEHATPTPPHHHLHAGYSEPLMRTWQLEAPLQISNLVYQIFVSDKKGAKDPINSMPEQFQWSVDRLEVRARRISTHRRTMSRLSISLLCCSVLCVSEKYDISTRLYSTLLPLRALCRDARRRYLCLRISLLEYPRLPLRSHHLVCKVIYNLFPCILGANRAPGYQRPGIDSNLGVLLEGTLKRRSRPRTTF